MSVSTEQIDLSIDANSEALADIVQASADQVDDAIRENHTSLGRVLRAAKKPIIDGIKTNLRLLGSVMEPIVNGVDAAIAENAGLLAIAEGNGSPGGAPSLGGQLLTRVWEITCPSGDVAELAPVDFSLSLASFPRWRDFDFVVIPIPPWRLENDGVHGYIFALNDAGASYIDRYQAGELGQQAGPYATNIDNALHNYTGPRLQSWTCAGAPPPPPPDEPPDLPFVPPPPPPDLPFKPPPPPPLPAGCICVDIRLPKELLDLARCLCDWLKRDRDISGEESESLACDTNGALYSGM